VTDSEHWARYNEVTVDRPAWGTVRFAIERFADEPAPGRRFAVDLGCGAGRDTRELLRAGWRVRAIDREPLAIERLEAVTEPDLRSALDGVVADLATVDIPACDLVNASVSLPFLVHDAFWATWQRALEALPLGGRIAAMLFGDRDESAGDAAMTCPSPAEIRESLAGFEIEHWVDREEDSTMALGDPHHLHLVEVVARRTRPVLRAGQPGRASRAGPAGRGQASTSTFGSTVGAGRGRRPFALLGSWTSLARVRPMRRSAAMLVLAGALHVRAALARIGFEHRR
jgi:tellurite methyltransferase